MRLGPASETLDTLAAEGKRFDLAFLDADKTGYLGYYKKVASLSRLLTGGTARTCSCPAKLSAWRASLLANNSECVCCEAFA